MSTSHLYILFGDISIQVLCPLFNWIICFCCCLFFCFLVLSCLSLLYILDTNLLLVVWLTNISSHLVGYLFVLLMVSFAVQKLFILM